MTKVYTIDQNSLIETQTKEEVEKYPLNYINSKIVDITEQINQLKTEKKAYTARLDKYNELNTIETTKDKK